MANQLRLMCITAHPDDETFGAGSTLAAYTSEGIDVTLLTVTRGQRGWSQDEPNPGPNAVAAIRAQELLNAADALGVKKIITLDYMDGEVDQAESAALIAQLVRHIRAVQPDVVITFGPDGVYGHPDHIAVSQATVAALVCAADPTYTPTHAAHRVAKLYFMLETAPVVEAFTALEGPLTMNVDGLERQMVGYPEWMPTTKITAPDSVWPAVIAAMHAHRSQGFSAAHVATLTQDHMRLIWMTRSFYRVFSTVNGGHAVETDLFAGLR